MKTEIKEILDDLRNKDCYVNNETILTFDEAKALLDYITNLQEENEDYKSRIDKAIEYIMTELITEWDIKNDGYVSGSDLPADAITPLLNILQGEDTKESEVK